MSEVTRAEAQALADLMEATGRWRVTALVERSSCPPYAHWQVDATNLSTHWSVCGFTSEDNWRQWDSMMDKQTLVAP